MDIIMLSEPEPRAGYGAVFSVHIDSISQLGVYDSPNISSMCTQPRGRCIRAL